MWEINFTFGNTWGCEQHSSDESLSRSMLAWSRSYPRVYFKKWNLSLIYIYILFWFLSEFSAGEIEDPCACYWHLHCIGGEIALITVVNAIKCKNLGNANMYTRVTWYLDDNTVCIRILVYHISTFRMFLSFISLPITKIAISSWIWTIRVWILINIVRLFQWLEIPKEMKRKV